MDYFDILLAKKLSGGGGGNITVEPITITENGTTTAPTGKAFSPIYTDVPLPENAYLLNDIEGLPKDIATFTDGANLPMPKLEVGIEPVQDLHGYDAPWVGGAGKNKFDESNFNDDTSWQYYTLTLNPNTTYTASSNNGNYYEDNTFPQLYVYATGSGAGSNNAVYTGHSVNITTGSDGVLKVQWKTNNNSKKMTSYHLQVEQGNQATSYAPYSNICPISGWDEVNVNRAKVYQICEPSDSTEITANGVTMTYLGKGKYRVKGTLTTNKYTSLNLPIVPFTIYDGDDCYIKLNNSVGLSAVSIIFKNNSSQVDSWGLYPSNRSSSYVGMRNKYTNNIAIEISSSEYGTNFDFTFKVEILSNSTANLSTYNISFGSVGTVYGGKVDLVSGVMTVTHGYVDLGTVNWDKYTNSAKTYFRTSAQLSDAKKSDSPSTTHNLMCSNYKEDTWSHVIDGSEYDGNICIGWNNNAYIGISDSRYVDVSVSDFKTAMNGVQLVYELATPITIQLTTTVVKSLRGMNNVWADSGDILDLSYLAKEE